MSEIKILCQNCQQKLAIPCELIGSKIECPSCNHTVKVAEQAEPAQASGKVSLKTQSTHPPAATSTNLSQSQSETASPPSTVPPPPPRRKPINPVTKIIRDSIDDGRLHSFYGLSDKAMLGISAVFYLPHLIGVALLSIPLLMLTVITLGVTIFFNTLFFIKAVSWICGRHVEQTPALLTALFTNSIGSLMTGLLSFGGIHLGYGILLISLFINAWIFELRLKEGFGNAILISLMIFILNVALAFALGCVGAIFFAGVIMTR